MYIKDDYIFIFGNPRESGSRKFFSLFLLKMPDSVFKGADHEYDIGFCQIIEFIYDFSSST